jgi:ribosomal protein S18 acetylase RimI-like enzyme
MTLQMRPYGGAADIEPILEVKRACTTPQNLYDRPTVSTLRDLLTPVPPPTGTKLPWQDEQGRLIPPLSQRALTQQATALWEEDGRLLAYALLLVPSLVLTFQVHPQARGSGVEGQILTWAEEQLHAESTRYGQVLSLWCRCHEYERDHRALLRQAGFQQQPWRDLRLMCPLVEPLPAPQFPPDFVLRQGITPPEWDQYQELHRAVFEGGEMTFDDHQPPTYQPDLDLLAVGPDGTFAAFCCCHLHQVADESLEYAVGEIGVFGTRPAQRKQGLGRALLLAGMQRIKERGGRAAFLGTEQTNSAAFSLFTTVGFQSVSHFRWWIKRIAPTR